MEARETDKLFRDKLKSMPSTPNAESWAKLASMLDGQEKPLFPFWRMAVAVLLLIASGVLVFLINNKDGQIQKEVAEVTGQSETIPDSHVIVPLKEVEQIEETQMEEEIKPQIKEVKTKLEMPKETQPVPEKVEIVAPMQAKEPIIIEEQQLAQAEPTEPQEQEKKKTKTIRITYKRGSKALPESDEMLAEQKPDTTGGNKIKELWEQRKDINPGDVWADIRDAKDNLFQRNSKKNNVKNLNK